MEPILTEMYCKCFEGIKDDNDNTDPQDMGEVTPEQDEFTEYAYNEYTPIQVMFTMENGYRKVKVVIWNMYSNGNTTRTQNNKPLLYYKVRTIEFYDVPLREYDMNLIMENMHA